MNPDIQKIFNIICTGTYKQRAEITKDKSYVYKKELSEGKYHNFYPQRNGFSFISQGAVGKENYETIDKQLESILAEVNIDSISLDDLYIKLFDSNNDAILVRQNKSKNKEHLIQLSYRMLNICFPDQLLDVTQIKALNYIKDNLNVHCTAGIEGKNWLELNRSIYKFLSDEIYENTDLKPYLIANLGWSLKTYFEFMEATNKLLENKNVILTGAPGTGKTYLAHEMAAVLLGKSKWDEIDNLKNHVRFVQFHPSYDYTDFVEGLRPKSGDNITFERKDGVFKAFCKLAKDDEANYLRALESSNQERDKYKYTYIFIIDEINRGDMSKIFGELFFSIDPGYRGKKGLVQTQYQNLIDKDVDDNDDVFKDGFYVPENVYIIGTMNDIDRSVESMDFAMRRRFVFEEILSTKRENMLDDLDVDYASEAKVRMHNLNYCIEFCVEGLNSSYHVGPAYFMPKDKKTKKLDFDELWNGRLRGLLKEYLRGMPNAKQLLEKMHRAYCYEEDLTTIDDNGTFKYRIDFENKIEPKKASKNNEAKATNIPE